MLAAMGATSPSSEGRLSKVIALDLRGGECLPGGAGNWEGWEDRRNGDIDAESWPKAAGEAAARPTAAQAARAKAIQGFARRGSLLAGIPAEHARSGDTGGDADDEKGGEGEPGAGKAGAAGQVGSVQSLDGVAAREVAGNLLRPWRQDAQGDADAADHNHRKKNGLSQRLHGGHGAGEPWR